MVLKERKKSKFKKIERRVSMVLKERKRVSLKR